VSYEVFFANDFFKGKNSIHILDKASRQILVRDYKIFLHTVSVQINTDGLARVIREVFFLDIIKNF